MAAIENIVQTYMDHYKSLRALAYSVVCNPEDADDIMQSVITRLIERADLADQVQAPLPFLRRCVRNEAISMYRKKKINLVPMNEDSENEQFAYSDPSFDEKESLLYIREYIKKQPGYIQEAFIAYVIDGERIIDIAYRLNMHPDSLVRRFRQIKVEIRQAKGSLFTMMIIVIW